jgi:malate dehydrogenase (oxaloacetate-decarboxylating)(NADP+)
MELTKEEILQEHLGGKLSVELKKKLEDQKDLSIAYTPGVAKVCLEIKDNSDSVYDYTIKKNSVAVVTDGTAVLGLGDIGPRASIPVMEGKAVLFKRFGKIDSWPVPLENVRLENGKTDAKKVIEAVKQISCLYGGINLEDIAAPACFEIEETLERDLEIPVFHDDQWGTAIIVLAAIKNYCILSEKKIEEIKIVVNGAGAAGIRICDMLKNAGAQNLFLVDSKSVVTISRTDLNPYKQKHARETNLQTLSEIIQDANVFIGVSVADCLTKEMVQTMNDFPAIFAMANPNPEITPEEVKEALGDKSYVMATGRSDYPNQINNVLGFPYIFRGALDAKARNITMKMKIAASEALAELARDEFIPEEVKQAYQREFKFGKDYIIPTPFDPRLLEKVGGAVKGAVEK